MDLAQLDIRVEGDRLVSVLRLHEVASERLVPGVVPSVTPDYAHTLFVSTLGLSAPKMNSLGCLYLRHDIAKTPDDANYLNLTVVITCPWVMYKNIHLTWDLPFLDKMADSFQLMTTFSFEDRPVTLVANRRHPTVEFGESSRTFLGFVKMGMGHIGARFEEWQARDGSFQSPDGIDHIFFVIALVLAGGSLWGLFKTATGFTVGHSITLVLSTYKIIHVHSKWIEVGIAFSIAYVAGRAFWRKGSRAENWMVAGLFGVVHGLGFSGALHDLELAKSEVLPALAGFNIGVEIGQCLFILVVLVVLAALAKISAKFEIRLREAAALTVCLTGLYWVYYRGFV